MIFTQFYFIEFPVRKRSYRVEPVGVFQTVLICSLFSVGEARVVRGGERARYELEVGA